MDYSQLVQDALEGNESALKAYAILKSEHAKFTQYIKEVEPAAFDEAANYDEKTFTYQGFQFTKKVGGKRFDFSNIKEWVDTKSRLKEIEDKAKIAYAGANKGMLSVAEGSGEVSEIPIVTYTKDSISLKKM